MVICELKKNNRLIKTYKNTSYFDDIKQCIRIDSDYAAG